MQYLIKYFFQNLHDYYKSVVKWGSDNDFIYLDVDNEIKSIDCSDQVVPPEIDKKYFNFRALAMHSKETINSNASGSGVDDKKYDDTKSTLLLPFSIYTSSITSGYRGRFSQDVKLDFTNLHEDKYGFDLEIPMQGVFTEKHVGGMQHRHVSFNRYNESKNSSTVNKLDSELTRPEGWFLEQLLTIGSVEYIINETFDKATTEVTEDSSILIYDPNEFDNWRNGINTANPWSFISGESDTTGTGPGGGQAGKYAYCDINGGLRAGQTFGLVTPLIDLLDLNSNTVTLAFKYHMHGLNMGILKVQASTDPDFITGVQDIEMTWNVGGTNTVATHIAGQQHANATDAFHQATVSTGGGLSNFKNKRFYIRFLYTAGITHLGEVALDEIAVYKLPQSGAYDQNSFKLLSPTHDNHNRPSAVHTRDTIAKRPINIRNIQTTGNLPTEAGNYLDRYEYVNTTSPEANDPWFVKNVDKIKRTTPEILGLGTGSIQEILNTSPNTIRDELKRLDYELPDRSFLTGSIKNRTRIKTRFSSPGGFEVMSRGYLDPAHEIYSVYNVMTFRNLRVRQVHNTQLQAHCGRFGVSKHTNERSASIKILVIDGDAPLKVSTSEKQHITLTSTDGTTKRYVVTDADLDSATATGTILSSGDDTGEGTAGAPEEGGIAVSVSFNNATQNDFLVELKTAIEHPNGHAGKMTVSAVPAEASGAQFITLTQHRGGKAGNTSVTYDIGAIDPGVLKFAGGIDQTARALDSEVRGFIRAADYTLSGDASRHKQHRNNIERIEMSIANENIDGATVVTASVFDNAFVSHMIPRTDQQTRWITASLI